MNLASILGPTLTGIGTAAGLLDDAGNVNAGWFGAPLTSLESVLSNATQRTALLSLLDSIAPPTAGFGRPATEKWHPLLGAQNAGNVFFTVAPGTDASTFVVGIGAQYGINGTQRTAAQLHLPVVSIAGNGTCTPIAGQAGGPLTLAFTVAIGLVPGNGQYLAVGLDGITVTLRLAPSAPSPIEDVAVTLHGLVTDDGVARDVTIDPQNFETEAIDLALGLIRARIAYLSGTGSSVSAFAQTIFTDLPPLLGLGSGIPPFPFATIASDPHALTSWLHALVIGPPPQFDTWLEHLVGLLGLPYASVVQAAGGTSWSIAVPLDDVTMALTFAKTIAGDNVTPQLEVRVGLSQQAMGATVAFEASATLLVLPLAGSGLPAFAPSGFVAVTAGSAAAPLVPPQTPAYAISLDSLAAGLQWSGAAFTPKIELHNVVLASGQYPVIDLSNAQTIVTSALVSAARDALGAAGLGAHVAALAGLIEPASDPAAPLVDPLTFATHPMATLAALHRAALVTPAHPWSMYFLELVALLGLPGPMTGNGTPATPWSAVIATSGPLTLNLVAWNAQTSATANDTQQLRVGLQLARSGAPLDGSFTVEVICIDFPSSGASVSSLLRGYHLNAHLAPAGPVAAEGITIAAASIDASLDYIIGTVPAVHGSVSDLTLTTTSGPGANVPITIPLLKYPLPSVSHIGDLALNFGIDAAQLERFILALLARAFSARFDSIGLSFAALCGCGPLVPGLQFDFPTISGPAGAGSLFSNLLAGFRSWLASVATGSSTDGSAFAPRIASWLAGLFGNSFPANLGAPDLGSLSGAGTYDDPWALPLGAATSPASALVWLEPAGPPSMAPLASAAVAASADFQSLASALAAASRYVPGIPVSLGTSAFANGLTSLAAHLTSSDGVVPVASQIPTGGTWTTGTPIAAPHHQQPSDASATQQIVAQIQSWTSASPSRAVVLLGPAFSDHTTWDALLAHVESSFPGTTNAAAASFNLRIPGVDPSSIDLRTVTALVDYYTADLQDDSTGNVASLASQIGLIVARVTALKPGSAVVLVAHSTAGLAARAYAAANAAGIKGLITLGTPHGGAPLTPLTDAATGDALRAYARTFVAGVAPGPLHDALDHLLVALDGYLPAASAGALPVPQPYPVGAFAGATSTDTGGVAALALGGVLGGGTGVELLGALKAAAAAQLAAFVASAPTHIGFGVRSAIDLGVSSGADVRVDATVRLDAGRIALASGAVAPPRPAHALNAQFDLYVPGGWLVGGPLSFAGVGIVPVDVRVRDATLGLTVTLADGNLTATPVAALHDASFHGSTAGLVAWGDAVLQSLLGSIFASIAPAMPAAPTPLKRLLAALEAFGIVTTSADHSLGISADAFAALQTDAIGYLSPKVSAAFAAAAVPGFVSAQAGTYIYVTPGVAIEIYVTTARPSIGVRTTTQGGLTLGDGVALEFDVNLPLASFVPVASATLVAGDVTLGYAGGTLTLTVEPEIVGLQLYPPPTAAAVEAALQDAVRDLIVSTIATPLLQDALGSAYLVSGVLAFLRSPGTWLTQRTSLGNDNSLLDYAKINTLIGQLGPLPAGLTLMASPAFHGRTTLALQTSAPIGGVVELALAAMIDPALHITPSGSLSFVVPLTAGTWTSATITVSITSAGIGLIVTPSSGPPITLLPVFDGAAALAGAGSALLPQALDLLVAALPASQLLTRALDVASALGIYSALNVPNGFASNASQLQQMLSGGWFAGIPASTGAAFVQKVAAFFQQSASPLSAASITPTATTISWAPSLAAAGSGANISVVAGWNAGAPVLSVAANAIRIATGDLIVSLSAAYSGGTLALTVDFAIDLCGVGVAAVPHLVIAFAGNPSGASAATVTFTSVGTDATVSLAIPPQTISAADARTLIEQYAVPLLGALLIDRLGSTFASHLWTGASGPGPTIAQLLVSAHIITASGSSYTFNQPLPALQDALVGLAEGLIPATLAPPSWSIQLVQTPKLELIMVKQSASGVDTYGIGLRGSVAVNRQGSPLITFLFGEPATWLHGDTSAGVVLQLFTVAGNVGAFAPALIAKGLGIGAAGGDDSPLINTSELRASAFRGYASFTLDLTSLSLGQDGLRGGFEVDQFGLPVSSLDASSSSNPVAASMLGTNGGGSSSAGPSSGGDASPVNPGVDIAAYDVGVPTLSFAGSTGSVVIPVHRSFGPVYIDQLDLTPSLDAVALGVDGEVSVASLQVGVVDLAVRAPLASLLSPSQWSLDLEGLAVSYADAPVVIAGGLRKNPGPPIEYDGMLMAEVGDVGLTVVGSYARPADASGEFTSLFMFAAIDQSLGGPPYAYVLGLGGGFGYNRALTLPADPSAVPQFVLVQAISNASLAANPMSALAQMGAQLPPKRGAFWLAAGAKITSFGLVQSTVVVSVACDSDFTVAILGTSRMALPAEGTALVSVELALKAVFDPQKATISVQAQLTDNSYLLNRDCRLTGGFAFFVWYDEGQFVVTLGGYNGSFVVPAQFPSVPRLGYSWSVSPNIAIKGTSYFALTNSCVMAGCSLNATGDFGAVKLWFNASLDMLIAWDPFSYTFDISIEIGGTAQVKVCLWHKCVTFKKSLSIGARLSIAGPPFHGTASINAYVTTITVSFGSAPQQPSYITDWNVFAGRYLTAGGGSPVSAQFNSGLLAAEPPNAQSQPGSASQPWQVGMEFTLSTTTRMPATKTSDFRAPGASNPVPGANALDLAAMDIRAVASTHSVTLEYATGSGWQPAALDDPADHFTVGAVSGLFPEATWHWTDPKHLPAAARTISAGTGLKIDGHAAFNDQSALIPIAALITDLPQYALPLPFATTPTIEPTLETYGGAARTLALQIAGATSEAMLAAADAILSGNGVFSQQRLAFGFSQAGLSPIARRALKFKRSAPPLVAPITTGLAMAPPGLPPPTAIEELPAVTSVVLTQPRLRAVLQRVPQPVADAPPAQRTSVGSLRIAAGAPVARMAPPTPASLSGARLVTVPAPTAPRPTRAALGSSVLRSADLGAAIGSAQQQALNDAVTALAGSGVTLGAGAAHLWDIPAATGAFAFAGDACARMVCMDRGGTLLSDVEFGPNGGAQQVAPGSAMVLVENLGAAPGGAELPATGFGAVSAAFAPAGRAAAVGWQSAGTLLQVGPARFAARGASVSVTRPYATRRNQQSASYGMARAGDAVRGQSGVETQLPLSVDVVLIALDATGNVDPDGGDVAFGCVGGTLATPPQRVVTGNRRLLLYDVATRDAGATSLTVAVASAAAFTVSAVIGLTGSALEWATTLGAGLPDQFVPDGPLSPGGSLTVSYAPEG